VGEAPGANEDRMGRPFVGQAGKLLDQLLVEVGLERGDVFISNVLLCRPPGNRDPHPVEIENCQEYLFRELELIQPRVVCTLGNFATKLLRGDNTGITRVHGRDEVRVVGTRAVRLYPLYHPAAPPAALAQWSAPTSLTGDVAGAFGPQPLTTSRGDRVVSYGLSGELRWSRTYPGQDAPWHRAFSSSPVGARLLTYASRSLLIVSRTEGRLPWELRARFGAFGAGFR